MGRCILVNSKARKKMTQQQKKILKLDHGLGARPDYYSVGSEDEDKSIRDIVLEIAEEWEAKRNDAGRMEATRLRGLLQSHNIYLQGREVSPDTKIADLNYDVEVIDNESAQVANINLQRQQTGG